MSIALTFIATGNYIAYVPGLIASARRRFICEHNIVFWCFSDQEPPRAPDVRWRRIAHEPWPGPTLHRYKHLTSAADSLAAFDYVFHCDSDMRFLRDIGDDMLGSLIAVLHPGHADSLTQDYPLETSRQSLARVQDHERIHYFAGGFQGGTSTDYLKAADAMATSICLDEAHGITAVWHDESHWNRYLIDNPPEVTLPPSFLACESLVTPKTTVVSLMKPEIVIHGQSARTR